MIIDEDGLDRHAYDTIGQARSQISSYLVFYNPRRLHSVHNGRTPDQIYFSSLPKMAEAG